MNVERNSYWDDFYKVAEFNTPLHPSQFSAFVLGEAPDATRVIEFGCGNGRDAVFFASYGLAVTALDASENAIDFCRRRGRYQNVKFEKFALGDAVKGTVLDKYENGEKTILYARFFLHAISEEEEFVFLSVARELIGPGSIVALEYRCSEDEQNMKEFGQHYRRYLRHDELCERIVQAGFEVVYQIKGRGFAKYKSEDALVGRCIAVKR